MPRSLGVGTNHLTIYMIKPEYTDILDIVETNQEPVPIEGVGQFVFEPSNPHPPKWIRTFFGNTLNNDFRLITSSSKGVLIVPITESTKTINFVVAFGVGRHLLKEGVIEERFGLKVVLNSTDQNGFRSIDKTTLGSVVKQSKEQMGRDVSPSEFGIDVEQDLISSVTATSSDPVLGKILTGKDALSVCVKVDSTNILEFLKHCLDTYNKNTYKTNFGWIDLITEVRHHATLYALNNALVKNLVRKNFNKTWMAVPEIIDWSVTCGFRYIQPKRSQLENDLNIEKFVDLFKSEPITFNDLKQCHIFPISAESNEMITQWSALKCIFTEVELHGKTYILSNGKWYEIENNFTNQVKADFDSIPDSTVDLIDHTSGDDEEIYNQAASKAIVGSCCMDQNFIMHGGGHNKIEFCDILTSDKKIIHVKKYGGSSVLNHLFAQGVVSAELLIGDEDFRFLLNTKLPRGHKLRNSKNRPDPTEYEIVYAIISSSSRTLDIPFFSKVSLRNARKRLTTLGFPVTKKKILTV